MSQRNLQEYISKNNEVFHCDMQKEQRDFQGYVMKMLPKSGVMSSYEPVTGMGSEIKMGSVDEYKIGTKSRPPEGQLCSASVLIEEQISGRLPAVRQIT